ncbi:hypothetical protein AJ79_02644 [Helicocarpus griseus UAMH5409]|uniref:Uncharacterized protein n=1 Tax=Helicocarpus griseus UAMH5409 TaxID=1447875 RepID=A0A2B7Y2S5_9EURO|nr:hypothetical protein AJ79_02644 [Helicocarpus griseus UAMH5409]
MLHPHWFTSRYVNDIDIDHFALAHEEFMTLMEKQEKELYADTTISSIMKKDWGTDHSGIPWLCSMSVGWRTYSTTIETTFAKDTDDDPYFIKVTHKFWTAGMDEFLAKKVKDKADFKKSSMLTRPRRQ